MAEKKHFKKQASTTKNSTGTAPKELLKTLQKILLTKSGSVTYSFESVRLKNKHSKKPRIVQHYAKQLVKLTPQFLNNKTPNELIQIFETTMHDLRAQKYEINF